MEKNIKREIFKGKYYWVKRKNNKFIERFPYSKTFTKQEVILHDKKFKTLNPDLLSRKVFPNFYQTVTKTQPKKLKNSQIWVEYDIFVNGEKLKKSGFGVSKKGLSVTNSRKSARVHGLTHIRGELASKGIITYTDKVKLVMKQESYINWIPKK